MPASRLALRVSIALVIVKTRSCSEPRTAAGAMDLRTGLGLLAWQALDGIDFDAAAVREDGLARSQLRKRRTSALAACGHSIQTQTNTKTKGARKNGMAGSLAPWVRSE
jgi:hypothetical protein